VIQDGFGQDLITFFRFSLHVLHPVEGLPRYVIVEAHNVLMLRGMNTRARMET